MSLVFCILNFTFSFFYLIFNFIILYFFILCYSYCLLYFVFHLLYFVVGRRGDDWLLSSPPCIRPFRLSSFISQPSLILHPLATHCTKMQAAVKTRVLCALDAQIQKIQIKYMKKYNKCKYRYNKMQGSVKKLELFGSCKNLRYNSVPCQLDPI